jgi:amino acid adenylation domain-containing protein
LSKRSNPRGALSYSPLFQVLFVVQNSPVEALRLSGLSSRTLEIETGTAKFDLMLSLEDSGPQITGWLEYNTDLFGAETIRRMMGHYQTLLEAAVQDPDEPITALPMLTDPERRQLLVEWNNTKREYPDSCVHELFEAQVRRTPRSVAVMDENTQLTYQELNTRANQLAHHLRKLGVGPEVLVGIGVERSVEMVVGLLGILKAGGAYVPLDPEHPKERLAFMVGDSGLKVLLSQEHLRDRWSWFQGRLVCLDSQGEAACQESPEDLQSSVEPNNLAYVTYTSGSTGAPKGVQISHRSLVNFLVSMQAEPGITANDTVLAATTLTFDIAGLEIYLPLSVGARVVLASRETSTDGRRLQGRLLQSGASLVQATPAMWRLLVESEWQGGKALKILCGGEALPRELARELITKASSVWNMYGPTETTVWSTVFEVTSADRPIPIGKPIANTEIYVLDRHLQPSPVGVAGELYIGGDGLARGYLNRPELTAEKFIPHPSTVEIPVPGDLAAYAERQGGPSGPARTGFVTARGSRELCDPTQ